MLKKFFPKHNFDEKFLLRFKATSKVLRDKKEAAEPGESSSTKKTKSQLDKAKEDELRQKLIAEEEQLREKKLARYSALLKYTNLNKEFLISQILNVPLASCDEKLDEYVYSESEQAASESKLVFNSDLLLNTKKTNYLIPSVTSVNEIAKPVSNALINWKIANIDVLGYEAFLDFQQNILDDSNRFHAYIAQRLVDEHKLNKVLIDQAPSEQSIRSRFNFTQIDKVLKSLNKVLLVEQDIVHPNLFYKGRFDCLAYFKGDLCLIDWKMNTNRREDIRSLYDMPVQMAAYLGAYLNDPNLTELRKNNQIKYGLLVCFEKETGCVDLHFINFLQAEYYWYKWLMFLKKFWVNVIRYKYA